MSSSADHDYLEIVYGRESDLNDTEDRYRENQRSCSSEYISDCRATIAMHVFLTVYNTILIALYILAILPPFWPLTVVYLLWMYYDRETPHLGGRKNRNVAKLPIWRWTRDYFPIKMVKTAELPADRNYLFASFPHGAISYGSGCNIMTDANDFSRAYPGLNPYTVTLDPAFYFPIARELNLALGLCSSSEKGITSLLNGPPGTVCVVIVGGARELQLTAPGSNKLVLRNRKGFVRLALKAGVSLVPLYSFGETNTFYQPTNKFYRNIQQTLKTKMNMTVFFLSGRGIFQKYFGLLPYRTPITTVVGKPIDLPKIENPTQDDIDKYHQIFISELEKLFNRFKGKYDPNRENAVLEIC